MRARARILVPLASAAVCLGAAGAGTVPGFTHASATGAITSLAFTPDPNGNGQLADPASLPASHTVTLTLTASTASGPAANAPVFVKFIPNADGGGSATVSTPACAQATLNATYTQCTTDIHGTVLISYTTPSTLPIGSHDTIVAADSSTSPTVTQSTSYHFSKAAHYFFDKAPLQAPNSVNGSPSGVPFTVSVEDAGWNLLAADQGGTAPSVAISFAAVGTTPGTAMVTDQSNGSCGSPLGATSYSSTPTKKQSTGGVVALCFWPPLLATADEVDTLTIQDAAASGNAGQSNGFDVQASDGYNANALSSPTLTATPTPIASSGTLAPGGTTSVAYVVKSGSTAFPYAGLSFAFTPAATGGGSITAGPQAQPLTVNNVASTFATDASGTVPVQYTAGTATSGGDKVSGTLGTTTVDDTYNYTTVSRYLFTTPVPIATRGQVTGTPTVTVQAQDANGNAVPYADLDVSFSPAQGVGTTTSTLTPSSDSSTQIGTTPLELATDPQGNVDLTYTPDTSLPGGQDVITVTGPDGSSNQVQNVYQFGAVTSYVFSTGSSLASPGSVPAGGSVNFTVAGMDSPTTPDTTAPVWLALSSNTGGGSVTALASCVDQSGQSTTTLGSAAIACTPDAATGVVSLTYTAPATLPSHGRDVVTAQDAYTNPAATGSASYAYGTHYAFSTTPLAPTGSVAPGASQPVSLTVEDGDGNPVGNASVMLSFNGAGSASVGNVALSGTPQSVPADGNGLVSITYTAPASLPQGGTDTITAASDGTANPAVEASDTYSFVSDYTVAPAGPDIAPAGSLSGGMVKTITVTPVDSQGAAAPGALTWVSFDRAAGGGSVTANGTAVGSSPVLVAADPSGHVTVVYTVPASPPTSGFDVITVGNQPASPSVAAVDSYDFTLPGPTAGYYLVARDGGIFSYGKAQFHGSAGNIHLNQPIVGMATTPDGGGYWLVASDGGIFSYGDAVFHGSAGNIHLNKPIVGMAATPSGNGYWLVASDGGIFSYGDAVFHGSAGNIHLNKPIVGMAATPSGNGYWLVASDGGIFSYGDAVFHGSTGNITLNKPIVGMATTPSGNGYWLVASDGGIFTYGDAVFQGSTGNIALNKPVVGMASTGDGTGYWMVASDGGIFAFSAGFYGSAGGQPLNQPIVGMAAVN